MFGQPNRYKLTYYTLSPAVQRASRRQAARRGSSARPATPEPLQVPRQRVVGVKREAAAALPAPVAVLQPPRNRRKGHPMRAAT